VSDKKKPAIGFDRRMESAAALLTEVPCSEVVIAAVRVDARGRAVIHIRYAHNGVASGHSKLMGDTLADTAFGSLYDLHGQTGFKFRGQSDAPLDRLFVQTNEDDNDDADDSDDDD